MKLQIVCFLLAVLFKSLPVNSLSQNQINVNLDLNPSRDIFSFELMVKIFNFTPAKQFKSIWLSSTPIQMHSLGYVKVFEHSSFLNVSELEECSFVAAPLFDEFSVYIIMFKCTSLWLKITDNKPNVVNMLIDVIDAPWNRLERLRLEVMDLGLAFSIWNSLVHSNKIKELDFAGFVFENVFATNFLHGYLATFANRVSLNHSRSSIGKSILRDITQASPNLISLDLSECPNLNEIELKNFGLHSKIKSLNVTSLNLKNAKFLKNLHRLSLEALNISNNPLSKLALIQIAKFPNLKSLNLSNCNLIDLKPLLKLNMVSSLDLSNNTNLTFEEFSLFYTKENLSRLQLKFLNIDNIEFGVNATSMTEFIVDTFPNLEFLSIRRKSRMPIFPILNINRLGEMSNLKELRLSKVLPGKFDLSGLVDGDNNAFTSFSSLAKIHIELEPDSFEKFAKIEFFHKKLIVVINALK